MNPVTRDMFFKDGSWPSCMDYRIANAFEQPFSHVKGMYYHLRKLSSLTEVTQCKLLTRISASARSTGTSKATCWRWGPRASKTTCSFMNIVDVSSPTETRLEQISFEEASASGLRICWRQGKAQGWPSSCQKPSLQSWARCSWELFYDCDFLQSTRGRSKEPPKLWV